MTARPHPGQAAAPARADARRRDHALEVRGRDAPAPAVRLERRALRASWTVRCPPPPLRTKWTRRVPHPALIGHAASLTPYSPGLVGATEPHCKQPQRRPPAPARRQPCARRRGLRDAPGAARSGAARSGAEGVWDAQGGVLRPGAAAAARARSEWSELARKADNTSKVNSCCARAGRVAARASRVGCRVARPPRRGGRCVARRCPVSF